MAISADRIRADIDAIATFTETPSRGTDRPTFSPAWRAARDYVARHAKEAGCKVRIDAAGNLHARHRDIPWEEPVWLSGSHIDSVPNGGNYDGAAGIVIPLEMLRTPREPIPLELIIFAEEEGTTFGLGMLGSRAWTNDLSIRQLEGVRNAAGLNYIEAGVDCEVRPSMLLEDKLDPRRYFGLIEAHIEQGPGMWKRDERVAIVTAIAGRRQYAVKIRGEANHAGSTSMADRKDALVAAATIILQLEGTANGIGENTVATVGRIHVKPDAINVIPAEATFTIDFRSPSNEVLAAGDEKIRHLIKQTCERRGLTFTLEATEAAPAVEMNLHLCERLKQSAARLNIAAPPAVSGALHDAAIIAPHLPTAMVFIASKDGVSHNPAELSRIEDLALAAEVIAGVVSGGAVMTPLSKLNEMTSADFVKTVGHVFEHSPWITERAFAKKPFPSVADLHEKMCGVVKSSTQDEKLALIRAHPDLVGRMAQPLTRESQSEQAAAGLTQLSDADREVFNSYNAAYHERFGFPFVICARENKKDAILAAFPLRLENSRDAEIETAVTEICKIAKLRLLDAIEED